MNAPRIATVRPLDDYRLLVRFVNGVEKVYDCTPLLQREPFRLLSNPAFFKAVQVDAGGYGISWNEAIDLSEYELWTNGTPVSIASRPTGIAAM